MAQQFIKLDEADNPEYYGLWRDHDELKKRLNDLNLRVHKIRFPKFLVWRARKPLKAVGLELVKLQHDYLSWRKKAVNFQMNPHYKIRRDENAQLVYLHATSNMRNLTDILESEMILLGNNYNLAHLWLDNKLNFLLALSSFALAFLALIITLILTSDRLVIVGWLP